MGYHIRPGVLGKFIQVANFINCIVKKFPIKVTIIAINANGYWRILQSELCFNIFIVKYN